MDGVRHCFVVNMFYNCDPDGKSEYVRSKAFVTKNKFTPGVKKISVTNTRAVNITGSAVFIYGLPESHVSHITIKDNSFAFSGEGERVTECPAMMDDFEPIVKLGFYFQNSSDIIFLNNKIHGENVMIGVRDAKNN
jgi:hypothetical protein